VVTSPGELDTDSLAAAVEATSVVWTVIEGPGETTAGGRSELVSGSSPTIIEELSGLEFAISSEAFFQTNTEMAERLYAVAVEYADLKGWERVYDLYCGAGTIALVLAARAGEVWGLELVEPGDRRRHRQRPPQQRPQRALLRGRRAAGPARPGRAGGPPGRPRGRPAARGAVAEGRPPGRRGGAQADRLRLLQSHDARAERGPARGGGLRAAKVRPVDMFPQTPHIECVALLEAGPDGVRNPERED
jgi:23S rRNA (uracil1939-C5)-methyltransferase